MMLQEEEEEEEEERNKDDFDREVVIDEATIEGNRGSDDQFYDAQVGEEEPMMKLQEAPASPSFIFTQREDQELAGVDPSDMDTVCGLCGDRGWPETLVCCVECSDAHRHRYCLDDVNLIFKIDLRWICEDCLPINPRATIPVAPRRSERLRAMSLKVEKMEIVEPKKDKEKKSRRFKIKKKAKTNLALRRSERLKKIRIKLETET
ncbi:hypothetical protein Dimus_001253 [Dionaea muscipula]